MMWEHLPFLQLTLMTAYHIIVVHALYYAPFYAWAMLISAWARRAPFLWAVFPPLAIGIVEKIAFNTTYFASLLGSRLGGGTNGVSYPDPGMTMHSVSPGSLGHFLISPDLWIGLALTAVFLAGAVRLRRYQGPI
jgi:ABC-2 type transport system permease protein